ncbi:NAD-dependent epimerase/dehydratase family protein [Phenylobacterium sp. LjRoot164]|uniref:NAD-dependent epimerase/dehydratase family protein n=1 Tax=unclassified Phenylobacterium TaxID=2640670 RepID=UPI003ECFDF49
MAQRVLVTGGTGFVGGWTIVELLRRGYQVRTSVRSAAREADVRAAVATQVAPDGLEFAVADLKSDAGWDEAVAGCEAVLHIASPLGGDDESLIAAAREGTLRVLGAAARAGVKRVVMTSSTAACTPAKPLERAIDESDWTDPDQKDLAAYRKSKVLAEKAAWDFIATAPQTQLTTILPGAIFGPVLTREHLGSVGIIQRLLEGQPPALPRLGFNISDVRDLADLHIKAMEAPQAAGQRYIALGESLWFAELSQTLRERLGEAGARAPSANMPDLVAKGLAVASPQMKALLPLLGRTQAFSTQKARTELGFAPRPARDTVADCGASLVD